MLKNARGRKERAGLAHKFDNEREASKQYIQQLAEQRQRELRRVDVALASGLRARDLIQCEHDGCTKLRKSRKSQPQSGDVVWYCKTHRRMRPPPRSDAPQSPGEGGAHGGGEGQGEGDMGDMADTHAWSTGTSVADHHSFQNNALSGAGLPGEGPLGFTGPAGDGDGTGTGGDERVDVGDMAATMPVGPSQAAVAAAAVGDEREAVGRSSNNDEGDDEPGGGGGMNMIGKGRAHTAPGSSVSRAERVGKTRLGADPAIPRGVGWADSQPAKDIDSGPAQAADMADGMGVGDFAPDDVNVAEPWDTWHEQPRSAQGQQTDMRTDSRESGTAGDQANAGGPGGSGRVGEEGGPGVLSAPGGTMALPTMGNDARVIFDEIESIEGKNMQLRAVISGPCATAATGKEGGAGPDDTVVVQIDAMDQLSGKTFKLFFQTPSNANHEGRRKQEGFRTSKGRLSVSSVTPSESMEDARTMTAIMGMTLGVPAIRQALDTIEAGKAPDDNQTRDDAASALAASPAKHHGGSPGGSPGGSSIAAVSTSPQAKDMPPGWEKHTDAASGRPYYHHEGNDLTTWERPRPDGSMPVFDTTDLPRGWEIHVDPSTSRPYYTHPASKRTSWEKPVAAKLPAKVALPPPPEQAPARPPSAAPPTEEVFAEAKAADDAATDQTAATAGAAVVVTVDATVAPSPAVAASAAIVTAPAESPKKEAEWEQLYDGGRKGFYYYHHGSERIQNDRPDGDVRRGAQLKMAMATRIQCTARIMLAKARVKVKMDQQWKLKKVRQPFCWDVRQC